jgi:hypothetical protein
MLGIPRRLRRPKAELRIESSTTTPPGKRPGGVMRLTVSLWPQEPFFVKSGRLELALLTTRFSRTALDGYHEHMSEEIWQTIPLCKNASVQPGVSLVHSTQVRLPDSPAAESRPVRMQWQVKARFEVAGHRELRASLVLRDASPCQGGGPVVDGSGYLPLYEFRDEFRADPNP